MIRALEQLPFVITVEEGTLAGGFGSAVLEAANEAGVDTRHLVRLGLPDRFVEHGERPELLADLGLDVDGICRTVRKQLSEAPRLQTALWPKKSIVRTPDASEASDSS